MGVMGRVDAGRYSRIRTSIGRTDSTRFPTLEVDSSRSFTPGVYVIMQGSTLRCGYARDYVPGRRELRAGRTHAQPGRCGRTWRLARWTFAGGYAPEALGKPVLIEINTLPG